MSKQNVATSVQRKDACLSHLSDFEWSAACQYLTYVEASAGLSPVSSAQIYNFSYTKLGPDKLIAAKRRIKHILEANLSSLAVWVGSHEGELKEDEKVVLRTLYKSTNEVLGIVDAHLTIAKRLSKTAKLSVLEGKGGEEDIIPF